MALHPITLFLLLMNTLLLFDFEPGGSLEGWVVVNDGVMGGRSRGSLSLSNEGHGIFSGEISLENYGGFSSIRYRGDRLTVGGSKKVVMRIKGDGRRYQFRIRENRDDSYTFISYFETSGNWEIIEIPLESFYPVFRGRRLDLPNYKANHLEEFGFLIGNKRPESFRLEIDYIRLVSD